MSLSKSRSSPLPRVFQLLTPELIFVISSVIVNGGNYLYNVYLGRALGPVQFAEAGMLVTLLLIVSFLGMTFQLVTAKYFAYLPDKQLAPFYRWTKRISIFSGITVGLVFLAGAPFLATYFNTPNTAIFRIMAIGMPFYFLMSAKRGALQGKKSYAALSSTYQTEMWSRLVITIILIYIGVFHNTTAVAWGITVSILVGYLTISNYQIVPNHDALPLPGDVREMVVKFFLFTAGYETVQIVINYSDILLVKHYFEPFEAGIYTSIALIGRMIYFIAWMFVMLLLPEVVSKKKDQQPHKQVLTKYLLGIGGFAFGIVTMCFFFPLEIVSLIFGSGYESASSLLWQYGLATAFFALSNVFVYYFLSTDKYLPVIFSGAFAIGQLVAYHFYHDSLQQMIHVQLIGMGSLLLINLGYFKLTRS